MSDHSTETLPTDARQIPGFPAYMIDTRGVVWSNRLRGRGRFCSWRPIKMKPGRGGYVVFRLFRNGKHEDKPAHKLVLAAFVGPCPDGMFGLHRDDVKTNNNLSNLYYGTRLDNARDAFRNGRYYMRKRQQDYVEMQELREAGITAAAIANKFNVSVGRVYQVLRKPA